MHFNVAINDIIVVQQSKFNIELVGVAFDVSEDNHVKIFWNNGDVTTWYTSCINEDNWRYVIHFKDL